SHHRVYWSDQAEQVREVPVDAIESARREGVPLEKIPELIARGEVRSANAVAALLMLRHLRLG
ncbi:NUDIX hydrolase, partial [Streptomyces sp. WM6386]